MPEVEKHEPGLLTVAKIIKEWGVRGAMKALPLSPYSSDLSPRDEVSLITHSGRQEKKRISLLRRRPKDFIIAFDSVENAETAASLRGALIMISPRPLPSLGENEYYCDQIVGLSVVTAQGTFLGTVLEVFSTGSNDVYVVQGEREFLIPAIRDAIRGIDLGGGKIVLNDMPGLLD